jgi:hypothetical protein
MSERKIRVVVAKPGLRSEGASTAPSETSPQGGAGQARARTENP